MFSGYRISLIIPCLDEERALPYVLSSIPGFINEVIVVDNGSLDRTAEIAKENNCILLTEKRKGYGQACLTGLLKAKGDILITIDGDDNFYMPDIELLLNFMIKNNHSFVSGCRFPLEDKRQMSYKNKLGNIISSFIVRKLFNIPTLDVQCGLNLFKAEIFPLISPSSKGMAFSQELKIKAWLHTKISCGHMHIHYKQRKGNSKFMPVLDSLKILYNIFKLLFLKKVKVFKSLI